MASTGVATVRSINHNVGALKEMPDVNIYTGVQSIKTELKLFKADNLRLDILALLKKNLGFNSLEWTVGTLEQAEGLVLFQALIPVSSIEHFHVTSLPPC